MKRRSFVLYVDEGQHIDLLPDTEAGKLFKALFHYVEFGDVPGNLDAGSAMAFSFIRAQIDRDGEKYERICSERSEAGKKGAATNRSKRLAKTAIANFATPNPADNDNEPDNDNVSVSDNVHDMLSGRRKVRQGLQTEAEPGGDFNSRRNAAIDSLKSYE